MDRALIERVTNAVMNAYSISAPVMDLETVVRKIGGKIIYAPSLPFYIDGKVEPSSEGDAIFYIIVSPNQSTSRLRFTIAHELGHLFLHMGYNNNKLECSDNTYHRCGSSVKENDANEFAANFLMPRVCFDYNLKKSTVNGKIDFERLANYFGVSMSAAINRAKWLGYIGW